MNFNSEMERLSKAERELYSKPFVSPESMKAAKERKERLDAAQLQTAENLKNLREQFEKSQRQQEIKDRKQEKENKFNRNLAIASFVVSFLAMLFTVITTLMR